MANIAPKSFTYDRFVMPDQSVAFRCSTDIAEWPWLQLSPDDPIVVQMLNFFVSVEAGIARGNHDPTKWSALTQTDWRCGPATFGHATHGIAESINEGETLRYRLSFFDATGRLAYRMSGTGVVFRTRNFEGWRAESKAKIAVHQNLDAFTFVPAAQVGLSQQIESFLAPISEQTPAATQALITAQNGMPPGHPYLDGSGDHVNSTHLADIARQFARLRRSDPSLTILGGEMRFTHYVELGYPFLVKQNTDLSDADHIGVDIFQFDKLCTRMQLQFPSTT